MRRVFRLASWTSAAALVTGGLAIAPVTAAPSAALTATAGGTAEIGHPGDIGQARSAKAAATSQARAESRRIVRERHGSAPAPAAALACPVPGAPGSPAATAGTNGADLTWSAAADNGSALTGYLLSARRGTAKAGAAMVGPAELSGALTGLNGAVAHTVSIQAVSACGTGPAATVTVTPTGQATTYASSVLADSPTSYVRFGETSAATTPADSAAEAAAGTFGSSVTKGIAGQVSGETAVDTSGWATTLPASSMPQDDAPRTVEGWVKPKDSSFRYLAGWGQSGDRQVFSVGLDGSQVAVITYGDDRYFPLPATTNLRDGNWHHIAVTYDGTVARAYLDGLELGAPQAFADPLETIATGSAYIGGNYYGSTGIYGGLDEVAIYPTALSQSQIRAHFTSSGRNQPGAPAAVSAFASADNEVQVTWGAALSNGGPVTGYVVRARSGSSFASAVVAKPGATAVRLGGLAGGRSYTFDVSAINAYGEGVVRTSPAAAVTGPASTYGSTVAADGPLAHYRFLESAGALYAANSAAVAGTAALGNVATVGAAGSLPGERDASVTLNGSCCLLDARMPLPSYDDSRTVEGWVKPSDTYYRYLAGWGRSGTQQAFAVGADPTQIGVTTYSDNLSFVIPGDVNLRDGAWHHIVVTASGTSVRAYLDGKPIGAAQDLSSPLDTIDDTGLWVGAAYEGRSSQWYGGLDEVAVYPAALSAARVTAHFAASGHARPLAPPTVSATAGTNSLTATWTPPAATDVPTTRFVVTARTSAGKVAQQVVPGTATTATLTGLAGGIPHTVTVLAGNAYGDGLGRAAAAVTPTGSPTTYASLLRASGPVASFRLGDSSSVLVGDSSATGTPARLGTAATLGATGVLAGDPDTSATLNGSCCAVVATPPLLPLGSTTRTVAAWVKPVDTYERYVLGWGTQAAGQAFSVTLSPTQIGVYSGSQARRVAVPAGLNLRDGAWHHIAVTYSAGTVSFYVDAVAAGTATFTSPLLTIDNGGLYVGAGHEGRSYQWYGGLDEVAVWNKTLTATQIADQFSAAGFGVPAAPSGVVALAQTNAVKVTWNEAPSPSSAVSHYLVTARIGTKKVNAVVTPASAREVRITGLRGGTAYTVSVQAKNAYGFGPLGVSAAATPTGSATTYAGNVTASAPLAYYRFSEAAGAPVAADSAGQDAEGIFGSPATLGTASALSSDPDTALTVSGSCCAVTATAAMPRFNAARSVEAWVKPADGSFRYVAGWGVRSTDSAFGVGVDPRRVGVIGYNDDRYLTLPGDDRLDDGAWHHIVVTYDGTSIRAYVDGRLIGTRTFTRALNTLTAPLYVGAGPEGGTSAYGGLDEVAIYGKALSAAEVTAHFAASGWAAPAQVGPVTASAGDNAITANWTPGALGAAPVAYYTVTALNGSVRGVAVNVPGSATSATLLGVKGGSSVRAEVVAHNSYGASSPRLSTAVTITGASTTYAAEVLSDAPVAYYRFSETQARRPADSSGKTTLSGSLRTEPTLGAVGISTNPDKSVDLTSSCCSSPGSVPQPGLPLDAKARTLEVWVKPKDTTSRWLIGYGRNATDTGFGVGLNGTRVLVSGYGNDLTFPLPTGTTITGAWHHVVVTFNGATATAYFDGAALGPAQAFARTLHTRAGDLHFGAGISGAYYPAYGGLDELAVYARVLTAAEVAGHYTIGQSGK